MDILELPKPVIHFLRSLSKENNRYVLTWDISGGSSSVSLTLTWQNADAAARHAAKQAQQYAKREREKKKQQQQQQITTNNDETGTTTTTTSNEICQNKGGDNNKQSKKEESSSTDSYFNENGTNDESVDGAVDNRGNSEHRRMLKKITNESVVNENKDGEIEIDEDDDDNDDDDHHHHHLVGDEKSDNIAKRRDSKKQYRKKDQWNNVKKKKNNQTNFKEDRPNPDMINRKKNSHSSHKRHENKDVLKNKIDISHLYHQHTQEMRQQQQQQQHAVYPLPLQRFIGSPHVSTSHLHNQKKSPQLTSQLRRCSKNCDNRKCPVSPDQCEKEHTIHYHNKYQEQQQQQQQNQRLHHLRQSSQPIMVNDGRSAQFDNRSRIRPEPYDGNMYSQNMRNIKLNNPQSRECRGLSWDEYRHELYRRSSEDVIDNDDQYSSIPNQPTDELTQQQQQQQQYMSVKSISSQSLDRSHRNFLPSLINSNIMYNDPTNVNFNQSHTGYFPPNTFNPIWNQFHIRNQKNTVLHRDNGCQTATSMIVPTTTPTTSATSNNDRVMHFRCIYCSRENTCSTNFITIDDNLSHSTTFNTSNADTKNVKENNRTDNLNRSSHLTGSGSLLNPINSPTYKPNSTTFEVTSSAPIPSSSVTSTSTSNINATAQTSSTVSLERNRKPKTRDVSIMVNITTVKKSISFGPRTIIKEFSENNTMTEITLIDIELLLKYQKCYLNLMREVQMFQSSSPSLSLSSGTPASQLFYPQHPQQSAPHFQYSSLQESSSSANFGWNQARQHPSVGETNLRGSIYNLSPTEHPPSQSQPLHNLTAFNRHISPPTYLVNSPPVPYAESMDDNAKFYGNTYYDKSIDNYYLPPSHHLHQQQQQQHKISPHLSSGPQLFDTQQLPDRPLISHQQLHQQQQQHPQSSIYYGDYNPNMKEHYSLSSPQQQQQHMEQLSPPIIPPQQQQQLPTNSQFYPVQIRNRPYSEQQFLKHSHPLPQQQQQQHLHLAKHESNEYLSNSNHKHRINIPAAYTRTCHGEKDKEKLKEKSQLSNKSSTSLVNKSSVHKYGKNFPTLKYSSSSSPSPIPPPPSSSLAQSVGQSSHKSSSTIAKHHSSSKSHRRLSYGGSKRDFDYSSQQQSSTNDMKNIPNKFTTQLPKEHGKTISKIPTEMKFTRRDKDPSSLNVDPQFIYKDVKGKMKPKLPQRHPKTNDSSTNSSEKKWQSYVSPDYSYSYSSSNTETDDVR
ncbi:hypothetical protein SNEBB_003979 [Seison nebaliae]|nr:hypothetical protein SNEBB_003979 [Seison nebaliae]